MPLAFWWRRALRASHAPKRLKDGHVIDSSNGVDAPCERRHQGWRDRRRRPLDAPPMWRAARRPPITGDQPPNVDCWVDTCWIGRWPIEIRAQQAHKGISRAFRGEPSAAKIGEVAISQMKSGECGEPHRNRTYNPQTKNDRRAAADRPARIFNLRLDPRPLIPVDTCVSLDITPSYCGPCAAGVKIAFIVEPVGINGKSQVCVCHSRSKPSNGNLSGGRSRERLASNGHARPGQRANHRGFLYLRSLYVSSDRTIFKGSVSPVTRNGPTLPLSCLRCASSQ